MLLSKLNHLHKILDPEIRRKNLQALRYALRGRYWDLRKPATRDPLFIVGCSRSGTTVTYETISSSPQLLSFGYELPQFWNGLWGPHYNGWESEAADAEQARPEHRDAAFRFFYQRLGLGQVVDKSCINVMRIPYLFKLFPKARFVFIHRDGRDNISSLMDGWRHDAHFGLTQFLGPAPDKVAINGGEFSEWSFFLPPGWRDYNQASLEEVCAFQWLTANRMSLDAGRQIPEHQWVQIRYEDIFDRPVEMFEQAFEKLHLPFDDAVRERCRTLNRRPTSIVNGAPRKEKWREKNPDAIERILERIQPMQIELGYAA